MTGISSKRNTYIFKDVILLCAITAIAYWPVSFFIFTLKNDSLIQYLPFRYHLSEAVQNGYFPFWCPYLYTGFPIHADMQGMTWNPIVLLISLFSRYNMSVLQFEVYLYFFIAAVAMYDLLRSFNFARVICLVGGVAYMSCGYINGSASVIPWISSAAFIPFVIKYFRLFLINPGIKSSILLAVFTSLLFLCCYPSLFIYTAYILFAALVFFILVSGEKKQILTFRNCALLVLSIITFLLLTAPATISYWDFLSYYNRGNGLSLLKSSQNPFPLFSSISYLFPNSALKAQQIPYTDIMMKNSYVGLFVFILFLLSFFKKYSRVQKLILGVIIFSFLFSLGDAFPLQKFAYQFLPFFNTFRHPSTMRLFTSLGIILLAAFHTQRILDEGIEKYYKQFRTIAFVLAVLFALLIIGMVCKSDVQKKITDILSMPYNLKLIFDSIDFNSLLTLECFFQLAFVLLFLIIIKGKRKFFLVPLLILNSVMFCWLSLPFTVVSQVRTQTINRYLDPFPDNYPYPRMEEGIHAFEISDSIHIPAEGYRNFYSKKIAIQDHAVTPTINKDYEIFCGNKDLRKIMDNYPFVYFADTILENSSALPSFKQSNDQKIAIVANPLNLNQKVIEPRRSINLIKFGPNQFSFESEINSMSLLNIFQQYNHNWHVIINGKSVQLIKTNIAFMGVIIPAGKSTIEFIYKPRTVIAGMWLSSLTVLFLLVYFTGIYLTKKRDSH